MYGQQRAFLRSAVHNLWHTGCKERLDISPLCAIIARPLVYPVAVAIPYPIGLLVDSFPCIQYSLSPLRLGATPSTHNALAARVFTICLFPAYGRLSFIRFLSIQVEWSSVSMASARQRIDVAPTGSSGQVIPLLSRSFPFVSIWCLRLFPLARSVSFLSLEALPFQHKQSGTGLVKRHGKREKRDERLL